MTFSDLFSKDEALLLRSLRLSNENPDNNSLAGNFEKNWADLQPIISKLIWLVQECDPYVVDLKHLNDDAVSIFELQVLYAIATFRCGHDENTIEILNWWLPSSKIGAALCLVRTITYILDEIEVQTSQPDRLTSYILECTEARLHKPRFHVIEGGLSTNCSRTLH